MTKAESQRLGCEIAVHLPQLTAYGSLLLLPPQPHLLRAISLEGSINKDAFYLHYFVQPLSIPVSHLTFSFGDRLRRSSGVDGWSLGMTNLLPQISDRLEQIGLPFLTSFRSPVGVVSYCDANPTLMSNPNTTEALAHAFVLLGKDREALIHLQLLGGRPASYPWEQAMSQRCKLVAELLQTDRVACLQQLKSWEHETLSTLPLPLAYKQASTA